MISRTRIFASQPGTKGLLDLDLWKTAWLFALGLPQWLAGPTSPRLREDLIGIGNGPILLGLIIPWGYVWRHYIKQPAER